ncbi:hypothetical protein ABZ297_07265 [Nonomuraea sp. NPDC005983]|uniref:hypothetical protein n=1 Tax=Nonomuraea sp. NPDC005983 TaxID=3155595 RepID=UPI0033BA9D0C
MTVGDLAELVACGFEGEADGFAVSAQEQRLPSGAVNCLHRILLRTVKADVCKRMCNRRAGSNEEA